MSTNPPAWYIPGDGKQPAGPFTAEQVLKWWQEGRLRADAVCWREGMPQWLPLAQVEPFASAMRSASPSKPPAPPAIPTTLRELVAVWDRCVARVRNAVAADRRIVLLAAGIAVLAILVIVVLAATGIASHSPPQDAVDLGKRNIAIHLKQQFCESKNLRLTGYRSDKLDAADAENGITEKWLLTYCALRCRSGGNWENYSVTVFVQRRRGQWVDTTPWLIMFY
jgi:hypothetical protein